MGIDFNSVNSLITVIGSILGSVVIVVGAYLRLFIANALNDQEKRIIAKIENEFSKKELTEVRMNMLSARISSLEQEDRAANWAGSSGRHKRIREEDQP